MSINEYLNQEEIATLKKELKKHKNEYDLYRRILAVLMVKSGETRKKAAEYVDVHRNTVGNWVKNYDKMGIDGLKSDYSRCGAESRLTDEQLKDLFVRLTDPNEHYSLRDARNLIKENYGIEYTPKQVWVITRKKLGLNYRKPYLVYDKAPENADEIFKKNVKNRP